MERRRWCCQELTRPALSTRFATCAQTNHRPNAWPRAPPSFAGRISTGKTTPAPSRVFTLTSLPNRKSKAKHMSPPSRFPSNPAATAEVVARFSQSPHPPGTSYATVRDYCESLEELPQVTAMDGDLKNVQRPWAAKTIMAQVLPPARLLEIGGGEPIVSGFLAELGYDVTLVDPYDGFGNGPTDYERYVQQFPHVKIVREYFRPGLAGLSAKSFDAIFSISVLEHLSPDGLTSCFD